MYTATNVEVRHFTNESAWNTKENTVRIRDNLISKHKWNVSLLNNNRASENEGPSTEEDVSAIAFNDEEEIKDQVQLLFPWALQHVLALLLLLK